jgi:hypothetical protein
LSLPRASVITRRTISPNSRGRQYPVVSGRLITVAPAAIIVSTVSTR